MAHTWNFERVAGPYGTTEGPVWDGSGVIFSDFPNEVVYRFDPVSSQCTLYHSNTGGANGLKLSQDGKLYACEMLGRRLSRFENGAQTTIVDSFGGNKLNSPNDLVIDSNNNVWFTDPHYGADVEPDDKELELDHRSVYFVDPEDPSGTLARVTDDTTNPNGIDLSPEEDVLYVAQSEYGDGNPRELRAYPISDLTTGTVGDFDVLYDFYPHRGIDGMAVDTEGNIVATAGWEQSGQGGGIYVIDPQGGLSEFHSTPVPRPTNCTFGGDNRETLYVTGSDGCLYRTQTDRRGLPRPPESGTENE